MPYNTAAFTQNAFSKSVGQSVRSAAKKLNKSVSHNTNQFTSGVKAQLPSDLIYT